MIETDQDRTTKPVAPGLAVIGCMATGVVALIGGGFGLFDKEFVGAGICLFAAAVAFGIVA
ncbi:MAG: hypothetical protein ACI9HE_003874, partial [Planctomycetota bacterium]